MKYDMVDCWIVKFTDDRKIKQVGAHLDPDLLTRAIEENKGLEKVTAVAHVNGDAGGSV